MTKRKPLCALAVSPYYLDKKRWSVCTMTVTQNRAGFTIWNTTEVVATFPEKYTALKCAIAMSNTMSVPVYHGIKKGDRLTDDEISDLDNHGLLAHFKS